MSNYLLYIRNIMSSSLNTVTTPPSSPQPHPYEIPHITPTITDNCSLSKPHPSTELGAGGLAHNLNCATPSISVPEPHPSDPSAKPGSGRMHPNPSYVTTPRPHPSFQYSPGTETSLTMYDVVDTVQTGRGRAEEGEYYVMDDLRRQK